MGDSAHPKDAPFQQSTPTLLSPRPSLRIAEPGPGMEGGTSPFGRRGIRTPLDVFTRETCAWELEPTKLSPRPLLRLGRRPWNARSTRPQ